jgi:glycosyltransferase involved in cell wall biosynthesis
MIRPLVSICVPTFNGQRHIRETLQSALEQDYENFEIVVSDGGSTDGTLEVLEALNSPRIKIFHHLGERTAAGNWNNAVGQSGGELVKLLCQDDLLEPDCLSLQVAALLSEPAASFCWGERRVATDGGRVLRGLPRQAVPDGHSFADGLPLVIESGTNPFGEPFAVLFRRSSFDEVGGFHGRYLIDFEMWLRLWQVGPFVSSEGVSGTFRLSRQSWSRLIGASQAEEWLETMQRLRVEYGWRVDPEILDRGFERARRKSRIRRVISFVGSYV